MRREENLLHDKTSVVDGDQGGERGENLRMPPGSKEDSASSSKLGRSKVSLSTIVVPSRVLRVFFSGSEVESTVSII